MRIGIPKETRRDEHRVGLTPFAVSRLSRLGHEIFVEQGAGAFSLFSDEDYREAGAQIVFRKDEVYQRSETICRMTSLDDDEIDLLVPGTTVCSFQHLVLASRSKIEKLIEKKITVVGYELIETENGHMPLLAALSEIAGQQSVCTAASLLQVESGGRGIVLGGIPGIAPATVVILGAGTLGRTAARHFIAAGAEVIVLDSDVERLRMLHDALPSPPITAVASCRQLEKYTAIADVLVGAIHVPGDRAPFLVREEFVKAMRPGSVILDLSIDVGGCVATSRPTTLTNPTFEAHGVVHYCVPNMTSSVPRTASRAVAIGVLPYIKELAEHGVAYVATKMPAFAHGIYLYEGHVLNAHIAESLNLETKSIKDII